MGVTMMFIEFPHLILMITKRYVHLISQSTVCLRVPISPYYTDLKIVLQVVEKRFGFLNPTQRHVSHHETFTSTTIEEFGPNM